MSMGPERKMKRRKEDKRFEEGEAVNERVIRAEEVGEFVEIIGRHLVFGEKVDEEKTEFVLNSTIVGLFEDCGDVVL